MFLDLLKLLGMLFLSSIGIGVFWGITAYVRDFIYDSIERFIDGE